MVRTVARILILVTLVAVGVAAPRATYGFADTCNARSDFTYLSPQNYYQIGDVVRVQITLGAGTITGGTHITISRVRFELDCTQAGVPCTDDGSLVSYVGNIGGTCPTTWASSSAGGVLPNEVVFTANTPIVINAGVQAFCNLEFDIQVNAFPSGTAISEAAGFLIPFNDAVCNTVGNLAAGNQSTGQLNVCNCNDNDLCTTDSCNPSTGCVYTPITCNDNNACTTDTCNPATGCVYTDNPPCNDNNLCTTDTCVPATGCVYTPNPPCNDNDLCTTDTCVPATGCVYTPNPPCNDNDLCTTDTCVPATGCVYTPNPPCNDNNACTTDTCVPATGCVYTPNIVCNDNDLCTTDTCDPATGCVYTPNPPCDDADPCTDDTCDPASGCVYTPNDQCAFICRTPGYWATHSSTAKSACSDVTGAVIAMGGGSINICGECITNNASDHTLPAGDAASAVEAMCVAVKGQQARQLARQLTAAALNCIISNAGADCMGGPTGEVFSLCNQGCAVAVGNSPDPLPAGFNMGWCIAAIDCYNNGFGLPTEAGCGPSTGCHDRALPWDIIPRPANCNGPAPASSERCQAAKDTGCGILPFDETKCASDSCP